MTPPVRVGPLQTTTTGPALDPVLASGGLRHIPIRSIPSSMVAAANKAMFSHFLPSRIIQPLAI
jgi:hypothetical protein